MKCHIEKITGIKPTTRVILPGVPAGVNAAAKDSASKIHNPVDLFDAIPTDSTMFPAPMQGMSGLTL
jgi:hypothetical protein